MASLMSIYQNFLVSPNTSALNNDATLNYITTLTAINGAAAIIKHYAAHNKVLNKKEEKILSCIEGTDALCLDVETTLQFITGGGAYLPGLDDNFIADRVVTFPMVHIVHFNSVGKIQQLRLYWDQGSLLKLVDVIGSRAKNWPIRDGKDQARLISSSAAGITQSSDSTCSAMENGSRDTFQAAVTTKPRSQSKNVIRDPYASLALFTPREEEDSPVFAAAAVAPRASAKPPQRDYHDLFVGNESDASPASEEKNASPKKENITLGPVAPKGGAGKNYQPSRLFNSDRSQPGTPDTTVESSGTSIKPDPRKYSHFEFGEGDERQKPMAARPKSKHQNNWDFADFMTPNKIPTKIRGQDIRHFGWSDDEPVMDTPAKHPAVAKPRPDATTNFSFHDGTPETKWRIDHHRVQGSLKGSGMYQNNVFDESDPPVSPERKGNPLADLKDRRRNFDPQFTMTDNSPSQSANRNRQPIPEARAKVAQQMGAQWEACDQSSSKVEEFYSATFGDKENILSGGGSKHVGIKSGGDGMGGKKGTGRLWDFGDDSPGPQPIGRNESRSSPISGDGKSIMNGGGKMHMGIKNGGDGMGGKKGVGRSWDFGNDGDEHGFGGASGGNLQASEVHHAPKNSAFWDF